MDEAEIAKHKYISVLVGSLDAPNQTFLVDCHLLDSGSNVNSSIILHTVDDILRQLEIKRENVSFFLIDAARYMSLAGKTLKKLYPSLMHVTCVAHLLHNCAMRMRAHFKNIDEIIATIKAATIKNKDRKKDFHNAGLPSPPDPAIKLRANQSCSKWIQEACSRCDENNGYIFCMKILFPYSKPFIANTFVYLGLFLQATSFRRIYFTPP